jgi:hypothetical protein
MGFFGDDYHRRRPVAFDVELDPPELVESDAERHPLTSCNDEPAVADRDDGIASASASACP